MYYSYDCKICPICGGKIKHPYTGSVSSEQLDEDFTTCLWIECVDEGGGTMGFSPMCRNNKGL